LKTKIPGGHPGVYAVPVQMDRQKVPADKLDLLAQRTNGLPLLLDVPLNVVAMYLEPGAMIDEHSADHPILFLVTGGKGTVRIGGPRGETRLVSAGDAVLWPAHIDHTVWTADETLQAIVIDAPEERSDTKP